jgi:hypothetical protein
MPRSPKKRSRSPRKRQVAAPALPSAILAIDIGGTKVKILASGEHEPRKAPSGKTLTPSRLAEVVKELAHGWKYEAITIGYPGLVGPLGPRSEPGNLGSGWVGFNFAAAFDRPVRIVNDASMQALGSYDGGRMLFLGFGTGLGSTLITENVIVPLELGNIRLSKEETLGDVLGRRGLKRVGKEVWRETVKEAVAMFTSAFIVDYVVLGGGNAKLVKELPPGARRGHNLTAFRGGFRLWTLADHPTLSADGEAPPPPPIVGEWRII